jgi:hypothetical protein
MQPKYVKLTAQNNSHNNFLFQEGLNTDHLPLNDKECEAGGLYFTDMDNWTKWIDYSEEYIMYWIWDCEPVGEIITFKDNNSRIKYKAQSFILSNPRCIWTDFDFQLSAIKVYGKGIQFIDSPTKSIQLEAIKQNICSIKYIKEPSEDIQLTAVKIYGRAIQWIIDPSPAVQIAAVEQNGSSIEFVNDPSEVVQFVAVRQNKEVVKWIKNPSKAVLAELINKKINFHKKYKW